MKLYQKVNRRFFVPLLQDKYNSSFPEHKARTKEQPFWIPMVAGATARIWAATIVSPVELVRTKMQSQKLSYMGVCSENSLPPSPFLS